MNQANSAMSKLFNIFKSLSAAYNNTKAIKTPYNIYFALQNVSYF